LYIGKAICGDGGDEDVGDDNDVTGCRTGVSCVPD